MINLRRYSVHSLMLMGLRLVNYLVSNGEMLRNTETVQQKTTFTEVKIHSTASSQNYERHQSTSFTIT